MFPSVIAPCIDGWGESLENYARQVELWRQVANLDPAKRAAVLFLEMDTLARKVCMAAGGDLITDQNGANEISELLRRYPASGAADSVFREIARFFAIQARRPDDGWVSCAFRISEAK